MQIVEAPRKERYNGLLVQYLEGQKDMPAVVIAKGLGIPGKEIGWMFLLNKLGFNVVYAPYRGTWLSEGKFLPSAKGELSVTQDVSDLVKHSQEIFGTREVYIIGDCFGASPALVTAAKHDEVSKVVTYGGMIYTPNTELNRKYQINGDKAMKLGQHLARAMKEGGEFFDGYSGFNIATGREMINGRTSLNPYNFLEQLARKKILAMHPKYDRMINYERTLDFVSALDSYCKEHGIDAAATLRIIESVGHDRKGHRTGFGPEEEATTIGFLAGEELSQLKPKLREIAAFKDDHKKTMLRPDGTQFTVPFYELVASQLEEFKSAGLLKDKPLEEILNEIL